QCTRGAVPPGKGARGATGGQIPASARAVYHVARQLRQGRGAAAEGLKGRDRGIAQRRGPCPRGGQSRGARVGRLAVRGVGAGRLAEQRRIALDVEDVVLDLEGEADLRAEGLEGVELRSARHTGGE